jgi:methylmalonyl-CoA mutase, N-terminal domain
VVDKLNRLKQAALGSENLLPLILEAAASYATVGEISDKLRSVFGEYREAA